MNEAVIKTRNTTQVWRTICHLDDLVPNSGVCALYGNLQLAIFYLPKTPEQVFVIGNYDPIGHAHVLSRGIVGEVQGHLVVASPLYKQHFSLRDGHCLEAECGVPCFSARIDGNAVQLVI